MKRLLSSFVAVLVGLVFLANASFAKEIKVGVVWPMTGLIAAFGQSAWKGLKLAESLQPKTKDGCVIHPILLDNKGDKVETANAVSKLITDNHVVAIIGAIASSNTLAGAPIAEKNKIPMLTSSATNPLVTKDKKYISRVCFIDPFQGTVGAKYAYNNLHAKTAVVMIEKDQDYSVGLAHSFMKAFKKLGGKILGVEFFQSTDQDYSAQIADIKSKNPDIIYMPSYYQEISLFARQARQYGLKQTIMAGDGAEADALIKIGGKAVEGVTFTTHYDPHAAATPLSKKFLKLFKEKYKEDPDAMAALGADAYFVLVNAIDNAGGCKATPDKINYQIRHTKKFEGVTGVITIDPKAGNAIKSAVIRKVEGGKFVYVTTVNP
ncbi:ABC transporter substrate-binding protein [Hippea maritima]|uniref:Extracellular ligand-binding receptor n=1 Tax=Hippea maritima (strain ATCC 700847 / DSM 10411 / MH2) TaxID=760142 RepID=F2LX52_HIPMA|nr:ABC transporter substrate-binding protein [Hippea maritima]AEA33110.1 Extracellular ligand-binding receptor [Hippea maritima DSM 10411]